MKSLVALFALIFGWALYDNHHRTWPNATGAYADGLYANLPGWVMAPDERVTMSIHGSNITCAHHMEDRTRGPWVINIGKGYAGSDAFSIWSKDESFKLELAREDRVPGVFILSLWDTGEGYQLLNSVPVALQR
jgi:hypothetical protein